MAFTYSAGSGTDRDRVRFHIGDTTENAGPLPADANFSDAEISDLVTANGSWQRAVAAALDILATRWARYPSFRETNGISVNRSDIAKLYRDQAADWRKQHGITAAVYVSGITKVDAYSDDVTSDDVDTSSEYGHKFEYKTVEP